MSGAGNDFIIIDNRNQIVDDLRLSDFIANVCRRKMSVGADGLILIENSDKFDFRWRFFNSDGSNAEMCGNGARCAARFAQVSGIAGFIHRSRELVRFLRLRIEFLRSGVDVGFDEDMPEIFSYLGTGERGSSPLRTILSVLAVFAASLIIDWLFIMALDEKIPHGQTMIKILHNIYQIYIILI